MRSGQMATRSAQAPTREATSEMPGMGRRTAAPAPSTRETPGWEGRLFAGLAVATIPLETRAALARALGELGVEAEYYLALLTSFPGSDAPLLAFQTPQARGEAFLRRLDVASRRLIPVADALEVATQSYLTALEVAQPGLREALDAELAEPWWSFFPGYTLQSAGGESLELGLRRCGYAFRHVVAVHLASNVEAVAEQLALTLHALRSLPPAGVAPVSALYQGLYELSSALLGYCIPHHVRDVGDGEPGILSGVALVRALARREPTTLESDLAWAREQYQIARASASGYAASGAAGPVWVGSTLRDWQETIAALERLRRLSARLSPAGAQPRR